MKHLHQLLARLPAATPVPPDDPPIQSIVVDSRAASPGALFVAVRGEHADGHDFVARALANGASAAIVERDAGVEHAAVVRVVDTRRALSALSAAFFDDPSHALDVVAITGTNGKTTVSRMLAAIFTAAGRRCGVIGTVGAEFESARWTLRNTTPLAPELHELLARMRDLGADSVAIEVSSHALALGRADDVRFRIAALTNVTRDHLDFHGTLAAYAAAKHRLFEMAERAVLNVHDEFGARWQPDIAARIPTCTYAVEQDADVVARDVALGPGSCSFSVDGTAFRIGLPGRFNVENALAAIAAARMVGIASDVAARGLGELKRVPGRMEHLYGNGVDAVVDYAHTPDALEKALAAVRETSAGGVRVVFGCGGERDRGKRPEMGRIAARHADAVYVTSDNPRGERPADIAAEIVAGIGAHPYVLELDRAAAIRRAILEAQPGDTVLIAGKGHETFQIVGEDVRPFDDARVAHQALDARKARA